MRNYARFVFYKNLAKDDEAMDLLADPNEATFAAEGSGSKFATQTLADYNRQLSDIVSEFKDFIRTSADLNAINLFLLATVQKELKLVHDARQNFGRSLMKMPLFR